MQQIFQFSLFDMYENYHQSNNQKYIYRDSFDIICG